MSIGPLSGLAASMAGTSLAQTRGAEADRAQQDNRAQELRAQSVEKAEMAAGIGQTDGEDHQAADRDADGRRPWEFRQHSPANTADEETEHPHAKDPSGQSGNMLDLSG